MAEQTSRRQVTVERVEAGRFTVTNGRGAQVTLGSGEDADFTPTELLLGALGGCTSVDVDVVTTRRAEPTGFEVEVAGTKVRDDGGNHLTDLEVTFRISFPEGPEGDEARASLPKVVAMSHDRLCTVGRTIELGTPVTNRIE